MKTQKKVLLLLSLLVLLFSCKKNSEFNETNQELANLPSKGYVSFGKGDTIYYTFKDGVYLLDEDYYLEPIQLKNILTAQDRKKNARGLTIDDWTSRWPNGVIPYKIPSNFTNPQRIINAINKINAETSISLVPYSNQRDYVEFQSVNGDISSSSLGRVGYRWVSEEGLFTGKQFVKIADVANSGTIIHELFHAAGLMHEHQRQDLGGQIRIDFSNIKANMQDQFTTRRGYQIGKFNLFSIMNYGSSYGESVAINVNKPVIYRRLPSGQETTYSANRDSIAHTDKLALDFLYGTKDNRKIKVQFLNHVVNEQYTDQSTDIYDVTRYYKATFHDFTSNENLLPTQKFMFLKLNFNEHQYGNGSLNLETNKTYKTVIIYPGQSSYEFSMESREFTHLGYYQPSTYMEEFLYAEVTDSPFSWY
ncbi:MAG: hypothetical protein LBV59_08295 [Sphingobacterium sp.]|jgi:hypothetical protein|uniref:M12 family metallopeptidase n=1 Tax=Sphingobacterium sp. TaxID=341027 RepID=UPI00284D14AE|nr:M12 family metallopeptidase [Sphingobacterium sp.]MDR3007915.1 hypothetical protein [Sphingobacterium sp.]